MRQLGGDLRAKLSKKQKSRQWRGGGVRAWGGVKKKGRLRVNRSGPLSLSVNQIKFPLSHII